MFIKSQLSELIVEMLRDYYLQEIGKAYLQVRSIMIQPEKNDEMSLLD